MIRECSFNRRRLLSWSGAALAGASSGWLNRIAPAAEAASRQGRHCVLLWMAGGPSQMDTFDMKPDHPNGGSFKEIATKVPGLRFSEHLPMLAEQSDRLAIMRGVSTKEGDHGRGTTLMRTGHIPGGPVRYPAIGCSLSKALGEEEPELPRYVSVSPGVFAANTINPGFLGKKYAATSVAAVAAPSDQDFAQLRVDYLDLIVDPNRHQQRLELWRSMQEGFLQTRLTENAVAQHSVYNAALRMISSDAKHAFDLSQEDGKVRESYGRGSFGQGCLMARRLIERGVPLVEVTLGEGLGWDTHQENFSRVRTLSEQLDRGWSTLMKELSERGLLEKTTILWAGEFGRTPTINSNGGRDHFPQAFSCVLAGGGIAGGQAYGRTSEDGSEAVEGKIDQQDLLATLCQALGVDPSTENMASGGRPIPITEGDVISEVLG